MKASNIKAMREALTQILDRVNSLDEDCGVDPVEIRDIARAALASPPRNCDMPLVVDGSADNNADKAWLVFKRQNPDAYFDVSGLLRCIDWLLAPAKEAK